MCFGSAKTPDVPATPSPTPSPVPAAAPGEVAASAESKRNKVAALKYAGMASTIKNVGGAAGVTGVGADLSNPIASAVGTKKTLGS